MISILESLVERRADVPIHYVHGTQDGGTHAMGDHVRKLAETGCSIRATTFYLNPRPEDNLGGSHDVDGLISVDWLCENTPLTVADYYLCGPKPFLSLFVNGLARAGVPACRIHYEFFGPADTLTEDPGNRLVG